MFKYERHVGREGGSREFLGVPKFNTRPTHAPWSEARRRSVVCVCVCVCVLKRQAAEADET
jgi:hypothetical protein